MIYLQLFLAFFQIGLFSFGGGYAALPLISQQVISTYHWISQNTFTDLITIRAVKIALMLIVLFPK